jgi:cyclophilin family peptidyl-prolyl cis-trans isomerase
MIVVIIPLFALALLLVSCKSTNTAQVQAPSMKSETETYGYDGQLLTGKHTVTLKTSKGNITVELDADIAPKTVTNFVVLAKAGYFDSLTFHRVIPGFMIQGGDPNGNGTGGRSIFGPEFQDEIDASSSLYAGGYAKGTIAMANHGPNTNGSQFFIMEADYPLPPNYTIFGHVTSGQDVVTAIANVPRNPQDNMPLEPVTFTVEVKN